MTPQQMVAEIKQLRARGNSDLFNSLRELNTAAMNRIDALEVEVASLRKPTLAQIVEVLDSTHDDSTKVTLINLIVGRCKSV